MKLALLNTSIITAPGTYRLTGIDTEAAKTLCLYALGAMDEVYDHTIIGDPLFDPYVHLTCGQGLDSAIGHESTAAIMTSVMAGPDGVIGSPVIVPVNRQTFRQEIGQLALVFKLNGRPPEGKLLSEDEIHEIGFVWQLLVRCA